MLQDENEEKIFLMRNSSVEIIRKRFKKNYISTFLYDNLI